MVMTESASPASAIVEVLRRRQSTQAEIMEATGLSRVTIHGQLGALEEAGVVCQAPRTVETGGRPARTYKLDPSYGRVLVADIGTSVVRTGVASIDGSLLASSSAQIPAFENPDEALRELFDAFARMRAMDSTPIRAISVGIPVPVNPHTGRPQVSARHSQWRSQELPEKLAGFCDGPFLVAHDVDLMALAEQRTVRPDTSVLMLIKVGMGIGCSVIYRGEPIVGETGGAFEIGHMQGTHVHSRGAGRVRCPRGHDDCLESVAGGRAIASSLMWEGISATSSTEIMNLAVAGNTLVRDELYATGRKVGEAAAPLINMLNPGVIVVGGNLTAYSDLVSQGFRESALLGTAQVVRDAVQIVPAKLGTQGGLIGASLVALDSVLSSDSLATAIAGNGGSDDGARGSRSARDDSSDDDAEDSDAVSLENDATVR